MYGMHVLASVLCWFFTVAIAAIACLKGAKSSHGCPASLGVLDLALSEGQVPHNN